MHSRGKQRDIQVFGHRGARGIFPENTIAGFQYLYDIGVTAVEIDVQNAANRLTVLAHDPHVTLAHDADIHLVRHITAEQVDQLKVGALRPASTDHILFPDQAQLPHEKVPTFDEFCAWAADHKPMLLNIEVKSHALNPDLYDAPDVIVSDVVDLLERHGLSDRCVISSFDWRVQAACAKRAPEITLGYLTLERTHGTTMEPNVLDGSPWLDGISLDDHNGSLPQAIVDLGGKVWCPYFKDLTIDALKQAQELGLIVNVWTVNDIIDIDQMIAFGVDGIISDYPARVQNALARRDMELSQDENP
ncbi:glycerophosphodiester phosphodiesterase family protein [Celeribacter sp.]|uniref:glycerophosphodiester phosphodiesterase family protein n=1 Tax=Celeribacter sp. TaxID=1890673 RepID=UPI003A8CD966